MGQLLSPFTKVVLPLYRSCKRAAARFATHARMEAYRERIRYANGRGIRFLLHLEYWRALWWEICSLYARMEIVRKNNLHRSGIALALASELLSQTHDDLRTIQRIRKRGIRKLRSIHRRAGLVDLFLLINTLDLDLFRVTARKEAECLGDTGGNAETDPHITKTQQP